jgi:hypothetical protein
MLPFRLLDGRNRRATTKAGWDKSSERGGAMTTTLERQKSLTEAKAILGRLAPGEAPLKTLDQAGTRIEELTGQKFRSLNRVSDTITRAREYFEPASRYIFPPDF